eukprot:1387775-Lingulodinium_polyedra.AAC.1
MGAARRACRGRGPRCDLAVVGSPPGRVLRRWPGWPEPALCSLAALLRAAPAGPLGRLRFPRRGA